LPNQIQFTEGHKSLYVYDAGGKKLKTTNYSVRDIINVPIGAIATLPDSSRYTKLTTDYVGNMIYENGALKEILLPEGYYHNGVFYYYLKDHLGNNRVTINSNGTVVEKSHYYPSGTRFFPESTSDSSALAYRYNGKEMETMNGLNQMDYGARRRFSWAPIWTGPDELREKYPNIGNYAYCAGNPIIFIDPDGRKIVGVTKNDATKTQQDFNTIFSGDKFANYRGLLTLDKKGRTFNSISSEALTKAFDGLTLNTDEQALVDQVTGAINSESVHKVEFVDTNGEVSTEGTSAFKTHLNNTQAGAGDAMIPSTNMPGTTMNAVSGGGINIPTENGSHSVIMEGNGVNHSGGRAVTTGHEIIGHGVASANGISGVGNNTRAIRVDNLIRRVMGITTFRDEHGGAKIVNPSALPDNLK